MVSKATEPVSSLPMELVGPNAMPWIFGLVVPTVLGFGFAAFTRGSDPDSLSVLIGITASIGLFLLFVLWRIAAILWGIAVRLEANRELLATIQKAPASTAHQAQQQTP